jgi:hypothetical protein
MSGKQIVGRLLLAAALAATGAGAALAVSNAVTPAVVTSSNVDAVKQTSTSVSLNTSTNKKVILSMTVPAGAWVITANLSAVNFSAYDYVRCAVYAASTILGQQSTMVGNGDNVGAMAVTGAVKLSSSMMVSLRCSHDTAMAGMYIDGGASLWAHKSTSLAVL